MARPEYIAALHEAKHELRFCDSSRKGEYLKLYKEALALAARESGLSETLLEAAVARDFWVWMKQEKLPRLSDQFRNKD